MEYPRTDDLAWVKKEEQEEEREEEQDTDTAGRFEVTDIEKAEWCFDRIRFHKAEIDKWTKYYDEEKKRVCSGHEGAIFTLTRKLKDFFFRQKDAGLTRETKTSTVFNTPSGKLVLKKQEPEYKRDDTEVIAWLKKNAPQFIKVEESVDWAAMKKAYDVIEDKMAAINEETGEIDYIPGITITPREDKFEAKPEVKKDV